MSVPSGVLWARCLDERVAQMLGAEGVPLAQVGRGCYAVVEDDDLGSVQSYVDLPRVVYMENCPRSSQDIARELAEAGAPEGTVVLCGAMEGGRGRYRRRWYAPRGGLWFTLILRPRALSSPGVLTLAAGVGVAEALRLLLGIDARLKWPNDIVVDGLKVAGILAEGAAVGGSLSHVLLGIGINVNNELPQELRGYAATLKEALGRVVPRATLFAVVITRVLRRCRDALGERAEEVLRRWRELSDTIGRRVVVKTLWGEVRGVAVGIDRGGRLLVDTGEGVVAVDTGDVIHLRSPGP